MSSTRIATTYICEGDLKWAKWSKGIHWLPVRRQNVVKIQTFRNIQ